MDIIDMISYESGLATGYLEGRDDGYEIGYHTCELYIRKREKAKKKRLLYFILQKTIGILLAVITLFMCIFILDGDWTFGLIGMPVSIGMIFSRKMLLVNQYWFKCKERRNIE